MLLADNVNVPEPALVRIAEDAPSLMIPVMDEVSELVIQIGRAQIAQKMVQVFVRGESQ